MSTPPAVGEDSLDRALAAFVEYVERNAEHFLKKRHDYMETHKLTRLHLVVQLASDSDKVFEQRLAVNVLPIDPNAKPLASWVSEADADLLYVYYKKQKLREFEIATLIQNQT